MRPSYSIIPPHESASADQIKKTLDRHCECIIKHSITQIIIYDVQDEPDRTIITRPYKYEKYMSNVKYMTQLIDELQLLGHIISADEIILFKAIGETDTENSLITFFDSIVSTTPYKKFCIAGNSFNKNVSSTKLISLIKKIYPEICIGSVILPDRPNELETIIKKINLGVSFFITQIIFQSTELTNIIDKLKDHAIPIYVTLSVISNKKTLLFMDWLGVCIPSSFRTEDHLITVSVSVTKSLINCLKIYTNISFSFEAVTHNKSEIAAINSLFDYIT